MGVYGNRKVKSDFQALFNWAGVALFTEMGKAVREAGMESAILAVLAWDPDLRSVWKYGWAGGQLREELKSGGNDLGLIRVKTGLDGIP